ncbi:NrsF family protein [Novosphingobium sp. TCA1]|jgi:hypothetical protein|uniref:NrsF family protein n=1 Tax=Novosphingobium sp. TCA1 TaxID=2682474 RepID=UPI001359C33C|nr:DUF1109 domain-containing protein [Novosphingobium sp. TCA1]
MSNESLIETLVGELRPVRRRNPLRQGACLFGLAAIELAAFLALGTMRPDIGAAMSVTAFWWKLGSLAILAITGTFVAIQSFEPSASPRRGLRLWATLAVVTLLLGWVIDLSSAGLQVLLDRLSWQMGVECLATMTALSIPPLIALGILMRSGAPTDGSGSALAAGAGAATWGAFVFAFHCPSDDPFYIVVWYCLGCAIVVGLARLILPRVARW